jgi:hypothetical protein
MVSGVLFSKRDQQSLVYIIQSPQEPNHPDVEQSPIEYRKVMVGGLN